jgi:hypothetical protein
MTTSMDTGEKVSAGVLTLPRASRAFLAGTTGTGKSTLMEVMMKEYQLAYSQKKKPVRTLIVDTKPRFKAQWELNGFPTAASGRYNKWGYGSGVLQGSYVLTGADRIGSELDQVWRLGGDIAIVQTDTESEWQYASQTATEFYERYGANIPRLVVVDELADFFKWRSLGDIFQRISRNGRERDCALITGSQRPRKVPVEVMTEMLRMYMFELDYGEDLKHAMQFGIPRNIWLPTGHTFYMYDKKLKLEYPSNGYFALNPEVIMS